MTRFYTYEYDLDYTFSIPSFYGSGQRAYALVKFNPTQYVQVQVKMAITHRNDVDTLGSGWNKTSTPYLRDVSIQLLLAL